MKRLAVLRHAKSRWDDPQLEDVNRPLNDRGWSAARRMGRELQDRGFAFDRVLASTAARVRETIDGVRESLAVDAPLKFDPRLYMASEELLLTIVRALPESVRRPLLVGHNPGLQQLLLRLSRNDEERLRRRVAHKFPTAAFAVVELPAHRWDKIEARSGRIVELILAKELD